VLTLGLTEVLRKKIVKQVLTRKNASNKNEKNTIAIKKEIVQANVAPTLPSHCANFATNKPIETVQFKTVVTVLFFSLIHFGQLSGNSMTTHRNSIQ